MAIKRYNAGIQRAKGLLEIVAALYDSSLSHTTRRAAFTANAVSSSRDFFRFPLRSDEQ